MKKATEVHLSLAGGLGNQIFQLAAALSLTEGPVYVYDHVGNARRDINNNIEIFNLNLPKRVINCESRKTNFVLKRLVNYAFRTSADGKKESFNFLKFRPLSLILSRTISHYIGKKMRIIIAEGIGHFDIDTGANAVYLVGYFQSFHWAKYFSGKHGLFDLNAFSNKGFLPFNQSTRISNVLAVHVRLGDYKHETSFGCLGKKYYESALENITSKSRINEIWLFSDEPLVAIEYIPKKYHEIVKVVPEASTVETIHLMSLADSYIIANSTFSWWGAFLSANPNPTVLAPENWFKHLNSPEGILSPDWKTLNSSFD